jgi:hypothetical protein
MSSLDYFFVAMAQLMVDYTGVLDVQFQCAASGLLQ